MTSKDLAIAVVVVEKLVRKHWNILRAHTARNIFLGACVVAVKFTLDIQLTTMVSLCIAASSIPVTGACSRS